MQSLTKVITHILAFFFKEFHDVRRQPKLILSLIGGPFIVMALFGATYRSSRPVLRTVLVWPTQGIPGVEVNQIKDLVNLNFKLLHVTSDRDSAMQMLAAGQADLIQIVPGDIQQQVAEGGQPTLEVIANTIDPIVETWIRSLTYGEVSEINRRLLTAQTAQAQEQAVTLKVRLGLARDLLFQMDATASKENIEKTKRGIDDANRGLTALLAILPPPGQVNDFISPRLKQIRDQAIAMKENLEDLQDIFQSGTVDQNVAQFKQAAQDIVELETTIDSFAGLKPDSIVSPVQGNYSNLRGQAYSLVIFFAPGVLALLIQHLSVTLGALALVREREMGAFEMFRVAPLHITEILIGKYLAYTLYVGFSAGVLVILLKFLNVPLLGPLPQFITLVMLLTLASLGIGFLISAISGSDSQAVQLSMLVLMLSVFFSGFFISLDGFVPWVRIISYSLPMTHGLAGFQRLMLIGAPPVPLTWIGLSLITLVMFVITLIIVRREAQRVQ